MNEFKLKVVLAVVGGVAFSLLFILLAFVVPLEKEVSIIKKPEGKLEEISEGLKQRGEKK